MGIQRSMLRALARPLMASVSRKDQYRTGVMSENALEASMRTDEPIKQFEGMAGLKTAIALVGTREFKRRNAR